MKKLGGLILATSLLAGISAMTPASVSAAACANTSTFGAISLRVPTLPSRGDYLLWVRMQSVEATGRVLIEINSADCYEVAHEEFQPNTWTWVAYRKQAQNQPVSFNYTEDIKLKVIGTQSGIKVDRVLLSEPGCTPADFGNNCARAVTATIDRSVVQALPPPSDQPVSGKVVVSNTPFSRFAELKRLSYSAGGRTVQSSRIAEPFDTTRLQNGKYTVYIESQLIGGSVIQESTVITVDNRETLLSPLTRWFKLNWNGVQVIGIIAGLFAISALMGVGLRKKYKQKREREFHGF